jgi:hypothetical protein
MAQPKAEFNLERFKSEVLGEGLARTNRFEVSIIPPLALSKYDKQKISMYCEVSNFPPLSLNVRQLRIFGPNFQRPVASDYGGDGLSMTFHVDRSMQVKTFFDEWIQFIVGKTDWTVLYPEDYLTSVMIRQVDEQNNITYEIQLEEAFPRSINIMELNNSAQSQTHRLNVIFAYRYWRTLYPTQESAISEISVGQIGARLTGGGYRLIPGTTLQNNGF